MTSVDDPPVQLFRALRGSGGTYMKVSMNCSLPVDATLMISISRHDGGIWNVNGHISNDEDCGKK